MHERKKNLLVRSFTKPRGLTKGFTLIELLAVMAIIGVVLVIGLNAVRQGQITAKDSQYKQLAIQLTQALQEYNADVGYYPYVACPVTGAGFDGTGSIVGLIPSPAAGDNAQAYNEYTSVMTQITKANASSYFGYCSSKQSGSGASAYIVIVQTQTPQSCTDTGGNNYYLLGNGIWTDPVKGRVQFDSIPSIYGLSNLTGTGSFSLSCFQS